MEMLKTVQKATTKKMLYISRMKVDNRRNCGTKAGLNCWTTENECSSSGSSHALESDVDRQVAHHLAEVSASPSICPW